MKIVVTGGCGYLGRYVMRALADHHVIALDRQRPVDHECAFVPGDVLDRGALATAFRGADVVIHLAAMASIFAAPEARIMEVNVMGTWNVCAAAEAAGVRRVVLCSSDSATGLTVRPDCLVPPDALPVTEGDPCHPTDGYSLSKRLGELVGQCFADRGSLEVVALRPVFVLYPRTRAEWLRRAQDPDGYEPPQDPASPKAGGGAFWHYILPEDAAEAFRLAAERPLPSRYNCYFILADRTLHPTPTADRARQVFGNDPDNRDERYRADPHAALFDTALAAADLGFRAITLDPGEFFAADC